MDSNQAKVPEDIENHNTLKKNRWIRIEKRNPQSLVVKPSKSTHAREELANLVERYQLKYRTKNDEFDLLDDFEKQFNDLKLNDDEEFHEILDRAERRDIPTSLQIRVNQNRPRKTQLLSPSPTFSCSLYGDSEISSRPSSRLSQGSSTLSRVRSRMPNSISDDVVNRRERSYHQNIPTSSGAHFFAYSPQNTSQNAAEHSTSEVYDTMNSPTPSPHHFRPDTPLSCTNTPPPPQPPPPASSSSMSYSNLVTYDSSFEPRARPHPLSLCVYCSNTLEHSLPNDGCPANGYKPSPNLILDDVLYRKIKQSSGAKTPTHPEPLFGIPNTVISSQLNDHRKNDYSRSIPEPRSPYDFPPYTSSRSWNQPKKIPNIINDDLAFRSLRRDLFPSNIQDHHDGNHEDNVSILGTSRNTRAIPEYYKKLHKRNRTLKKFSFVEDVYNSSESQESPDSNWSDSSIII